MRWFMAALAAFLCACERGEQEATLEQLRSMVADEHIELSRVSADLSEARQQKADADRILAEAWADADKRCPAIMLHILKLEVRQGHRWSLNPLTHVKDHINASEFEVPVDADYFASVSVGQELADEFRLGSALLRGSISSMVVKVIGKRTEMKR